MLVRFVKQMYLHPRVKVVAESVVVGPVLLGLLLQLLMWTGIGYKADRIAAHYATSTNVFLCGLLYTVVVCYVDFASHIRSTAQGLHTFLSGDLFGPETQAALNTRYAKGQLSTRNTVVEQ